jgi:hypothetical protein
MLPLLALIAVKDQAWYGVSNAISPSSSACPIGKGPTLDCAKSWTAGHLIGNR